MTSEIEKSSNYLWNDKEKVVSSPNVSQVKSAKRSKSPKKCQEYKNDTKINDVFLNSEYFKYHSGNKSSLSFCSGDNGEHRWTVDTKFEIPFRKTFKVPTCPNGSIRSETAVTSVLEKSKSSKSCCGKVKRQSLQEKGNFPEKEEKSFLVGTSSSERESNDRDLISLITEQMFLAERELEITRTHLVETISKLNERDLEIIQLHEKIRLLQKSKKTDNCKKENQDNEDSSAKTSEDYQRLVMASEKLKKQVKDMEEFLNDYGLVWIGNKESKPDFDKIMKSFQRLNTIACQPKMIQTPLGAKFELPRGFHITLYANGILLREKDFREYNSVTTNMFLQDVEDGFFPSELQSEYPEGVPFEVVDKRNEVYNRNCQKNTFQGQGNRLGSTFEGKPSSIVILEPMKPSRKQDSSSLCFQEYLDRHQGRTVQKRRSKSVSLQDDTLNLIRSCSGGIGNGKPSSETDHKRETEGNSQNKPLKVKIRYGKEKTESFLLEILENEKMHMFQTSLNRKLCERYHADCLLENGANIRCIDFELHIYGKTPFRLSENLNKFPKECGIVDNCVINLTEI